jgi:mono/diheme cytochrome c family protein
MALCSSGCRRSAAEDEPPVIITPDDRKEAAAIFASRCLTCHGPGGQGDGPSAPGLRPRPKDLTDKMWQSNVTDRHIERVIQYGGAAVGKSPVMPPNPDLAKRPVIVAALRAYVRSLAR